MSSPRSRPDIWGIVNVTPDSFSDGGLYASTAEAVAHGLDLAGQGADVLDVGGESTRPGAPDVPSAEEHERVVPVICGLRDAGVPLPISVDTQKAEVARRALDAGATIVNDVSGGTHDPDMLPVVAAAGAQVVLMHMRGTPRTMQDAPRYDDVVTEVLEWLSGRVEAALQEGVGADGIWIDPGIGFGKTVEHNVEILTRLEEFVEGGRQVLIGASRKSFLGHLTGREVDARLAGSLACAARAMEAGVHALRVHDVAETHDLLEVLSRIRGSRPS